MRGKQAGDCPIRRLLPFAPAARAALRDGENVLAIHVRQTRGGQYVDAGLVELRERDAR